jgi:hypothetical protein
MLTQIPRCVCSIEYEVPYTLIMPHGTFFMLPATRQRSFFGNTAYCIIQRPFRRQTNDA